MAKGHIQTTPMASADPIYAGVFNKSCLPLMVRTIGGKQCRLSLEYHLGPEVIQLFHAQLH